MSRTFHHGRRDGRPEPRIRVRGIRREPADLRRIARVIIEFARADAEATAQNEHHDAETSEITGMDVDDAETFVSPKSRRSDRRRGAA